MPKIKNNIQELSLEEVMGDRFGRYSKYIIQERALPDVRDGLKPVQRRILYAMMIDGNTYNKPFRKSAKSVGNVMGNFHPHGDSSIYDAMVRLSQNWKLREPLIEMHGNNGSMDGDPPAAMRYTEARLSKIAGELLADIDKKTVKMVLNFDDTEEEPTVLPSAFPNLLVNGATGISAGYATEIPPHNLGEVIDGTIYLIDHPDATLADITKFIKGPDFPTGGILQGRDGIKEAYQTGRGKVVLRAKTQIKDLRGHRQQIIITELPYEVNKALLVKKIDELRMLKKVDGIAEVRDESDRFGLSIAIDLKRDANANGILDYLFKNTELQVSYNFNMVAIADMQPKQMGLLPILQAYLAHRRDVITKRTTFDLQKAQERQHIVAGLIKALSILDQVIKTIRSSNNKKEAKVNLVKTYGFTEQQAESIVNLQLYRLTNADITALQQESAELDQKIANYHHILDDNQALNQVIKTELQAIKTTYATPRLTKIEDKVASLHIDTSVMVTNETVMVQVTHEGYMKRSSLRSYQASAEKDNLRENDHIVFQGQLQTLDHLYLVTNKGHLIYRPVYEISEVKWKDTGEHLSQTIGLANDEVVLAAFSFQDLKTAGNFVLATNLGYIKQTSLANVQPWRTYRSKATQIMKLLKDNEVVINASFVPAEQLSQQKVLAITKHGYSLRFALSEVPVIGAKSHGVKLINLKNDDEVASQLLSACDTDRLGIITQRGAFKQMNVTEIPVTSRALRGVVSLRELKNKPHRVIAAVILHGEHNLIMIQTQQARLLAINPADYNLSERYSNGTFVLDTEQDGQPQQVWLVAKEQPEE